MDDNETREQRLTRYWDWVRTTEETDDAFMVSSKGWRGAVTYLLSEVHRLDEENTFLNYKLAAEKARKGHR